MPRIPVMSVAAEARDIAPSRGLLMRLMSEKDHRRFQANISTDIGPCRLMWTGCTNQDGYGRIRISGRTESAHRIAYAIEHDGRMPELEVCHSCDVRNCVTPEHLWLGTHLDNMQDAARKGRMARSTGERNGHATKPECTPRGEMNPRAKLTVAQVLTIRQSSRSCVELAHEYGVSDTAIRLARTGRNWRSI